MGDASQPPPAGSEDDVEIGRLQKLFHVIRGTRIFKAHSTASGALLAVSCASGSFELEVKADMALIHVKAVRIQWTGRDGEGPVFVCGEGLEVDEARAGQLENHGDWFIQTPEGEVTKLPPHHPNPRASPSLNPRSQP